jgi:hypothetical protein
MSESAKSSWVRTLADVERAVGDCLTALERYEAAFSEVLAEHGVDRPEAGTLAVPAAELSGWDRPLTRATQHIETVDQLLAEQEAVWAHWQQAYSAWRQSLEQAMG